jgi:hypothetical protein
LIDVGVARSVAAGRPSHGDDVRRQGQQLVNLFFFERSSQSQEQSRVVGESAQLHQLFPRNPVQKRRAVLSKGIEQKAGETLANGIRQHLLRRRGARPLPVRVRRRHQVQPGS